MEPDAKVGCSPSGGRKRSYSQAWDALSPKALSELTSGLLAGGWDNALGSLGPSSPHDASGAKVNCSAAGPMTPPCDAGGNPRRYVAAEQPAQELPGVARGGGGGGAIKGCKGRRVGSATKRPLKPDRMERKATREKRRREEVCFQRC